MNKFFKKLAKFAGVAVLAVALFQVNAWMEKSEADCMANGYSWARCNGVGL